MMSIMNNLNILLMLPDFGLITTVIFLSFGLLIRSVKPSKLLLKTTDSNGAFTDRWGVVIRSILG